MKNYAVLLVCVAFSCAAMRPLLVPLEEIPVPLSPEEYKKYWPQTPEEWKLFYTYLTRLPWGISAYIAEYVAEDTREIRVEEGKKLEDILPLMSTAWNGIPHCSYNETDQRPEWNKVGKNADYLFFLGERKDGKGGGEIERSRSLEKYSIDWRSEKGRLYVVHQTDKGLTFEWWQRTMSAEGEESFKVLPLGEYKSIEFASPTLKALFRSSRGFVCGVDTEKSRLHVLHIPHIWNPQGGVEKLPSACWGVCKESCHIEQLGIWDRNPYHLCLFLKKYPEDSSSYFYSRIAWPLYSYRDMLSSPALALTLMNLALDNRGYDLEKQNTLKAKIWGTKLRYEDEYEKLPHALKEYLSWHQEQALKKVYRAMKSTTGSLKRVSYR